MDNHKIIYTVTLILLSAIFFPACSQQENICDSLIKSGIDLMWKKEHEKSLEKLSKAKYIADKKRWYKQSFNASNNIGGNYYLMLDYGEALKHYLIAYNLALTRLDERNEMTVLNNIAILYSKEKTYDKAYEYFLKAYTIAKKENIDTKTGYYAINLGSVLNEMKRPLLAQKHIEEALDLVQTQPEIHYLAKIVQTENDFLQGKYELARERAVALLKTKNKFSFDNQVVLSIIIAKIYEKENDLIHASEWAKKALTKKTDPEKRIEIFKLLSDIYIKQQNYKAAIPFKDSINSEQNKLSDIKNGRLFESSQIKFQLLNYKKEIAEKNSKISNDRIYYISVVGFTMLLLVFVTIIYRNQSVRNKHHLLLAERNQEIASLKLQKETDNYILSKKKEELALLEQERLKKGVELQNQKIASKALYLSGKDLLLQEILKSLSKTPELNKNKTLLHHVRELKKHLSTEDEWSNFILHFEEVNQGLLQKLKTKHPELNQNDLRYISYEYMNLSTKEIATLLNITLDACRKRKERIVLKLGLSNNSQLNNYLSSI